MAPTLGTGPPSDEEMAFYYQPMFDWETVKAQVDSGDLGNLKRHPALQERYDIWTKEIKEEYGTIVNYLVTYRLGWGPTESRPATPSCHAEPTYTDEHGRTEVKSAGGSLDLPTPPATRPFTPNDAGSTVTVREPQYFTADIPEKYVKIIPNDWPYSIPLDVKHFVFWTRVPIIHPAIVSPKIWKKVEIDGLWGFTGGAPESVANISQEVSGAEESDDVEALIKQARFQTNEYVKANWREDEWETAWFVNPPRLQSIPGLAHGHVFARRK